MEMAGAKLLKLGHVIIWPAYFENVNTSADQLGWQNSLKRWHIKTLRILGTKLP